MALTLTTLTSDVTAPVNYVLMRGLLMQARKVLPYFNGTLPGTLEKNGGSMSVKWRRLEDLTVSTTALGELTGTAAYGQGRNADKQSITDLTAAIAKYGNYIYIPEELDLFNVNSRAAQILDNLGRNAGETLNVLMRGIYNGITTNRFGGGVTAITAIITSISKNDIAYCCNLLNRASAMRFTPMGTGSTNVGSSPIRASYYGVCHSDVEEDIRNLTGFVGVETYGGYTETEVGEFGHIGGVRWCSTPIAPISTVSATTTATGMRGTSTIANDVYHTFIYGKEAIGTVGLGENHTESIYQMGDKLPAVEILQQGPGGAGDPYGEVRTLAWKAWWAGKVLNSNWVMKLSTLCSSLT